MADSNNSSGLPPPPPPMGKGQEDNNNNTSMPQQQNQQQGPPPRMPAQSPTPQQSQPQQQTQQPPSPSPSPSPSPTPSNTQSSPPHGGHDDISTEEYVEAVIEERWADIEDDIRKIVEWKNDSEQRITQLSQQFEDLKDRFDKLHQALIGKIESYDKNIMEVGAELKAMEKVFSKVMPSFTENVKQLDDITKKLDSKK